MYGMILLMALNLITPQDTILPDRVPSTIYPSVVYDTLPDSMNMQFVGSWPYGPAFHVYVVKDIAFLATGCVVYILDVSDPYHPVKISEIKTRGVARRVYYSNGFLYIANWKMGLDIWNVMNLYSPYEVGWYRVDSRDEGYAVDVVVKGNYAYLLTYGALHILDVSTPMSPVEVATFHAGLCFFRVLVSNNYAYVLELNRLYILDITDPRAPTLLNEFWTGDYNRGIFLDGDYIYITNYGHFEIWNVSNPAMLAWL